MNTKPPRITRTESRRLLAINLPRIMAERQITVAQLAAAADVCRRVLHRAILGQTDPALSLGVSVARALGVAVEDLVQPAAPPKKTRKRS